MLNLLLLFLACGISILTPLWGLCIFILAECSIFYLGIRFLSVNIGIGYVSSQDLLVLSLCYGALRRRLRHAPKNLKHDNSVESDITRIVKNAVVPYVLWIALCSLRGVMIWYGTEYWSIAVRFFFQGVVFWAFMWIAIWLQSEVRSVIRIATAVAVITAVVHIAIQLFSIRGVMLYAYWFLTPEYEYLYNSKEQITQSARIVRGLPQGYQFLIYFFVFYGYRMLRPGKWNLYDFAFAGLCFTAIFITYTRTLSLLMGIGFLMLVVLSFSRREDTLLSAKKLLLVFFGVGSLATLYVTFSPDSTSFWLERFGNLKEEKNIISSDTNRGNDNYASIMTIRDNPIMGVGIPRYLEKYSRRKTPPSDIHPMLQIGLVGGGGAILLAIRCEVLLLLGVLRVFRRARHLRSTLIPYISIITLSVLQNTMGGGGVLSRSSLATFSLFLGIMCAEVNQPSMRKAAP